VIFVSAVYIPANSNGCDHLSEYLDTPVLDHKDSELDHPELLAALWNKPSVCQNP